MKRDKMDNEVQVSVVQASSVDTKKIAYLAMVGLAGVVVIYFVSVLLLSSEQENNILEKLQDEETTVLTSTETNNTLLRPDSPMEQILVEGLNTTVLHVRVSYDHGRILALPKTGQALYTTSGTCTGDCLAMYQPYFTDSQFTDGSITTHYREDTGTYQYAWNGSMLYTYSLDTPQANMRGENTATGWEFARP